MENIVILRKLFCFKELSTIELTKINTVVHTPSFQPGEAIIKEGEKCGSLYVIKHGSVTVSKGGTVITSLGAGELVGEISFLDKGEPSATVTATKETALVEIPGEAFEELMEGNKELAYKVLKAVTATLCQKLRNADDLISIGQLLLLPPTQ